MDYNGHKSSRTPLKTLKMVKDKTYPNMFKLVFEEGGTVPENISGMYNGIAEAQKAIEYWTEGYTRDKITPQAPRNDIPTKLEQKDGKEKSVSRV